MPCVAEVVNRSLKADCTDFTNSYTLVKIKFKSVVIRFQLSNSVFFLSAVLFEKNVRKLLRNYSTGNHEKLRNFQY